MAYQVAPQQPPPRDPKLSDGEIGPGLYAGELAVLLDGTDLAAVRVSCRRQENGGGLALMGFARLINADGSTKVDADNQHIRSSISHNANPVDVQRFGEQALAKEVLLAVLGEPPTMVPVQVDPAAAIPTVATDAADKAANPNKLPPGTVVSGKAATIALIPWSDEVRLNGSAARARDTAKAVGRLKSAGAAALLASK